MKKHNGIVSLWKFIFALVIAFFHCNSFYTAINKTNVFFSGGYIAVEFFFIVSGFYFAKKILKEEYSKDSIGKETFNFILDKLKRFMPYVLIAFLVSIALKLSFVRPIKINYYVNSIWNLLLLREFGLRSPIVIPALWYLSTMLFCMLILYPIVKKHKENFIYIGSPIIILLGLGYLSHYYVDYNHSYIRWIEYLNSGMLRGLIDINIGMLMCLINERLQNVKYTKFTKFILTLISELSLIGVLLITTFIKRSGQYDYVMLLMITISLQIILSEKTLELKLFSNKIFYYLERLSLLIFINHGAFINMFDIVPRLMKLGPVFKSLSAIGITILFSIIELLILDFLKKKGFGKKVKELIVAK